MGKSVVISRLGEILILLSFLTCWVGSVEAQGIPSQTVDLAVNADELLLIGYAGELSSADLSSMLAAQGFVLAQNLPHLHLAAVSPDPAGRSSRSQTLATMGRELLTHLPLRYVEANGLVTAADLEPGSEESIAILPDDSMIREQWALTEMGMVDAWAIGQGSANVVVAVIDSGYDLSHEDLSDRTLWSNRVEAAGVRGVDDDGNGYVDDLYGWDWVDQDGETNDPYGHGTHVGGIVAAATDNGIGIASVGRNLSIMPLRILNRWGSGTILDLIAALDYARTQHVSIINLSLVTTQNSIALQDAIQAALAQDILVVAAAGNANQNVAAYFPAAWPDVLTIAAIDAEENRAAFSNYGDEIDLAAPGVDILSTYREHTYYLNRGTSMAAPQVAGIAGLVWSLRPDLSRDALVNLLKSTARDVNAVTAAGPDSLIGHGTVDGAAAMWQASADLQLQASPTGSGLLAVGSPGFLPVTVFTQPQAGASVGPDTGESVAGAVVQYETSPGLLARSTDGATSTSGYSLSDATGQIGVNMAPPSARGPYTVTMQVGQTTARLPLFAYMAPLTVTGNLGQESISPGLPYIDFEATIQDGSGQLVGGYSRVVLETNAGRFANGQPQMTFTANQGRVAVTIIELEPAQLLAAGELRISLHIPDTGLSQSWSRPVAMQRLFAPILAGHVPTH